MWHTISATAAALCVGVALAASNPASGADAPATEWKPVEEALGTTGQLRAPVFRVAFPRTDLKVTVQGIEVKPGFALGSYAAFRTAGSQVMVMGDLALLDEEIPGVMSALFEGGLHVTALHNHLNEMSPHVMYMHFAGHGDPVQLAKSLRHALEASATPLGGTRPAPAGTPSPAGPVPAQTEIEKILGRSGTANNGVLQVSVPRATRITEDGIELLPAMGVATVLNFQPTGDGKAAITGDFVLTGREVNPVARALRSGSIAVTAVHQHALNDTPRLFYMHFWAHDDALKLARGLRAALDLTATARPPAR